LVASWAEAVLLECSAVLMEDRYEISALART
jgi:hypothetical protein